MKISTKGRYGLRTMVDIALNTTGKCIPLKEIAKRQDISERYLEQILSTLKNHNLLLSIKGAHGGYKLNDSPSKIKVLTIINALEGDFKIASYNTTQQLNIHLNSFLENFLWKKVDEEIIARIENITLEELIREYTDFNQDKSNMYYI